MSGTINILLVGIGGYGQFYVKELLENEQRMSYRIAGIVDIRPESSTFYEELKNRQIPFFTSMEEFYLHEKADLAIISTPIHCHSVQVCQALQNGSNVLCEKPISATVQEARQMIAERDRSGKFVAIGFNWSFLEPVQQLKQDILKGLFGKPLRLKTIALVPRNELYFSSGWKGRQRGPQGEWVLDSVAHNAVSHYLHNMFYLLGPNIEESIGLERVEAELYRANAIENFDTCTVRATTVAGTEVLFYASHAVRENLGPRFHFEFEKAIISFDQEKNRDHIYADFHTGDQKLYSFTPEVKTTRKLWVCLEAVAAGNANILCGLEAAYTQVLCINGMYESVPNIVNFADEQIQRDGKAQLLWVEGLHEAMISGYEQWKLPAEAEVPWAVSGKSIHLAHYDFFRGKDE